MLFTCVIYRLAPESAPSITTYATVNVSMRTLDMCLLRKLPFALDMAEPRTILAYR